MKIKYLYLSLCVFSLFFFSSCDNVENIEVDYAETNMELIEVDKIPYLKNKSLSNIIKTIDYVVLETNDDSLFGEITDIKVVNEKIFIHDRVSDSILVFSAQGKFLNRIDAKGEGPGEFVDIESFTIDSDNDQIIIGAKGKILVYDFKGSLRSEIKTVLGMAWQISYTGNNVLAIYTNYINIVEEQKFNHLLFYDLKDKQIVGRSLPFNKLVRLENMTSFYNSFSSGEVKYLSIPYKEYVWEISGNNVFPAFHIDFGDNSLSKEFEEDYLSNPRLTSSLVRQKVKDNGWSKLTGNAVLVGTDHLCFTYYEGGEYHEIIYDLNTRKGFKVEYSVINDLDGSDYITQRAVFKDQFVSIASAGDLLIHLEEGKIEDKDLEVLISDLEVEDNPVLRFIRYKSIKE